MRNHLELRTCVCYGFAPLEMERERYRYGMKIAQTQRPQWGYHHPGATGSLQWWVMDKVAGSGNSSWLL